MKVDVLILNYNGEKLLAECLSSIIEAKKASKNEVTIIVIDNESTDRSLEILEGFPVEVVRNKNRVLCSFNDVVRKRHKEKKAGEVLVFLNNDIKVDRNFIDPIVKKFKENDDAFLVQPEVLDFDGKNPDGSSIGRIKRGMFQGLHKHESP